ncbi:hypothetical protein DYB38_010605 [Aphanomyces astaci]|uniref:Uncharacterized protein n=1 Tax=Aphanomyces astaci TaxID=112090 RepID=A0A397DVC5_APHAT|nr:hypothetical protein DYB38_010605 [Aphanomyces astaci]
MGAGEWHSRWPRRYRATLTSKSTVKKKMNLLLQMRRSAKARKSSSSSLLPRGQTKALTWHVLAIRPSRFDFALDDAWRVEVVHGNTASYSITLADIRSSKDTQVVVAMDFPYCVTNGAYNTYPAGLRLRDIAFSSLRAPPILSKSTQKSMVQYGADKDTTPLPRHAVLSHQAFVVFEMEDAEMGHWKPLGHEHGIICIVFPRLYGYNSSPNCLVRLAFSANQVGLGCWEAKGHHDVVKSEERSCSDGAPVKAILNPLYGWFAWYSVHFPANSFAAQQCLSWDVRRIVFNWRVYWMVLTFWTCFPLYGLYHSAKLVLLLLLKGQAIKYHAE